VGKWLKEALGRLKRHLSNVFYRPLMIDARMIELAV
jgi:hypothetical protein